MLALEILTYLKYAAVSRASQALKSHSLCDFTVGLIDVIGKQVDFGVMLALEILTCLKYAFDKDWIGFTRALSNPILLLWVLFIF